MVLMVVVVPDGLRAGDEMSVTDAAGQSFTVAVPEGCGGGMELEIDLPSCSATEPPSSEARLEQLEVVVPDGVRSGQSFSVENTAGQIFDIVCPEGCGPGSAILIELPAAPEPPPPPLPAPAPEPSRGDAADDDGGYKFHIGQRVELYRSDGAESPGTIVGVFEGVLDTMYRVKLDNGLYKEAVPEDEISDKVTGDLGDLFGGFGDDSD